MTIQEDVREQRTLATVKNRTTYPMGMGHGRLREIVLEFDLNMDTVRGDVKYLLQIIERISEYAQHASDCSIATTSCSCGLAAALMGQ